MANFTEEWLREYQSGVRTRPSVVAKPAPVVRDLVEPQTISLALTAPPSVNDMFANIAGVGRVKTKHYRQWLKMATQEAQIGLMGKETIRGKFKATIYVAANGDLDNRVKATLDLCQAVGAIENDIGLVELHVYRQTGSQGIWIVIEKVGTIERLDRIGDVCSMATV